VSEWREAVREELARVSNAVGGDVVSLTLLYDQSVPRLAEQFPDNDHVEAKLRQILGQDLLERGEVERVHDGMYRVIDLELDADPDAAGPEVPADPVLRRVDEIDRYEARRIRESLLRDRSLVDEVKRLHDDRCQVCGARRGRPSDPYSEAHHVRPLGDPHLGPDTRSNLLVVCPNHHVDFDRGLVVVDPDDLALDHATESIDGRLRTHEEHELDRDLLAYHAHEIATV
jgi:hypothetical protein